MCGVYTASHSPIIAALQTAVIKALRNVGELIWLSSRLAWNQEEMDQLKTLQDCKTPELSLAASPGSAAAVAQTQLSPATLSSPRHSLELPEGHQQQDPIPWDPCATEHLPRGAACVQNQTHHAGLLHCPHYSLQEFWAFPTNFPVCSLGGDCLLCKRNSGNGCGNCPRLQRACG